MRIAWVAPWPRVSFSPAQASRDDRSSPGSRARSSKSQSAVRHLPSSASTRARGAVNLAMASPVRATPPRERDPFDRGAVVDVVRGARRVTTRRQRISGGPASSALHGLGSPALCGRPVAHAGRDEPAGGMHRQGTSGCAQSRPPVVRGARRRRSGVRHLSTRGALRQSVRRSCTGVWRRAVTGAGARRW